MIKIKKSGIRLKFILVVTILSSAFFATGTVLDYINGKKLIRTTNADAQRRLSMLMASYISDLINDDLKFAKITASRKTVVAAIKENNARYQGLDWQAIDKYLTDTEKKWTGEDNEDPLVKEVVNNDAGAELRSVVNDNSYVVEALATDRFGAVVAASRRPDSFNVSNKDWWKGSFNGGTGNDFIGRMAFDKTRDAWCVPFAVPIRDKSGALLGVCKLSVDIKRYFELLTSFRGWKNENTALVDDNGYLIYHPDAKPFKNKFSDSEELHKILMSRDKCGIMNTVYMSTGKTFVAFSEVDNAVLSKQDTRWWVFVTRDAKAASAPLYNAIFSLFISGLGMLVLIIMAIVVLTEFYLMPIKKLHEGIDRVAAGDMNCTVYIKSDDEMGEMASAFNKMTGSLKTEWQRTFDAIPDIVFMQDKNSTIIRANAALLKALGAKHKDVIGKKSSDVFYESNKRWPGYLPETAASDKRPITREIDDSIFGIPLLVTISQIFNEEEKLIGTIHIARDISSEKKAMEDIENRKLKLEKIEKFQQDLVLTISKLSGAFSVVTQEISYMAGDKGARSADRDKKTVDAANAEIDILMRRLERLLEIGKLKTGAVPMKKEVVDFKDLIRKCILFYEPKIIGRGLGLKMDIPKGEISVYGNADKLRFVTEALIGNAVKFTEKGHIDISVRDVPEDEVEFVISDTGIGISRENIHNVFERFQQFSHTDNPLERGTGLSLSLAKEIIDLHSGSIWVESVHGKGTKFAIKLPKHKPGKT